MNFVMDDLQKSGIDMAFLYSTDEACGYYKNKHSFENARKYVEPPFQLSTDAAENKYLLRHLSDAAKQGEYYSISTTCFLELAKDEADWEPSNSDEE